MRRPIVRNVSWEGTLQRVWDFPAVSTPQPPGSPESAAAPWSPDAVHPGTVPLGAPATTIVMVHGFRGDHHGLLRFVEELPGHRVILPDLPGFGQGQELPGRHDVTAYARFITHLARGSVPEPCTLLGHSFGSIVAAEAAALTPELVRNLVLVNPISAPALEGPSRAASRLAEAYYVAAARLPEGAGRALLANRVIVRGMSAFMAKTKDPALRRWIHGQHDSYFSAFASRRVVLEAFRASISGTVRDRAAELTMPVLLVAAEQDDIGSVESQRLLSALIPSATLEVIPDVGHLVHYEKPGEAALLIEKFLEAVTV